MNLLFDVVLFLISVVAVIAFGVTVYRDLSRLKKMEKDLTAIVGRNQQWLREHPPTSHPIITVLPEKQEVL